MVSTAVTVVAVFAGLVLFGWAPLLSVTRLRALFVWPTRWLAVNYLLIGAGFLLGQCLVYLGLFVIVAGTGPVTGGDAASLVGGVVAGNLVVPGLAAVAALRVLPARGYWATDTDGLSERSALGLGVMWYAIVASIAFVIIGLGVMFANLPT